MVWDYGGFELLTWINDIMKVNLEVNHIISLFNLIIVKFIVCFWFFKLRPIPINLKS